ncbi:MAG TPA: response regulator [Polyangia bacterium]|nr:response regulator [Polyangia bacterium]
MTPPRALIVYDDPTLAGELANELSGQGYRVDIVDSGLAAIRQVWEERYDRVLVDPRLRGMRAFELMRHIGDLAPQTEVTLVVRQAA